MRKNLLFAFGVAALLSAGAYAVAEETGTPEESNATVECAIQPGNGEAVRSISTVNVKIMSNGETMYQANQEILAGMTITKEGREPAAPIELGYAEPEESDGGICFIFPVMFEPISEAGIYTISVPEGSFVEIGFNDQWEEVPTGKVSKAVTTTVVVDPNMKSDMEFVTLQPASGEKVNKISMVVMNFDKYTMADMILPDEEGEEQPSISDGTTVYKMMARASWEGPAKTFELIPLDAEEKPIVISEAGEWTLNVPEGYFSMNGEYSPAITAKYTLDPSYVPEYKYTVDPANGSTVELPDFHQFISFSFAGVDVIDFEQYDPDDIAMWRVSYNGNPIKKVENPRGDAEENLGWGFNTYYGEGDFQIIINENLLKVAGVLKIEADKGAFTLDGNPSPAIDYTLNIGEVKEYEVNFTPASGAEVELAALKTITIEFANAESAEYNSEEGYFAFSVPGTFYPGQPVVEKVEGAEHPSFTITFADIEEKAAATGGPASLKIYDGSFILDGVQPCEEIEVSWNVKRTAEVNLDWIADPMEGYDIVNRGEGIYAALIFNEFEHVTKSSDFAEKAVVKFQDNVLDAADYMVTVSEGYKVLFDLNSDKFKDSKLEGKLQVIIPEGCLNISGVAVPAIDYTWNVIAAKEYTYVLTPSPEKVVNSLTEITVEFPEAVSGNLFNEAFISLREIEYTSFFKPVSVEAVEGAEHATFKITFDCADAAAGKYILSINEGAFSLDVSQVSPSIEVTYELDPSLSGVNEIVAAGNGNVTVVTLDGRVVLKNAPASRLSEIANGIYVVNGKKYIVKK